MLRLVEIEYGTVSCVASAVKKLLTDRKLPTESLIGIGLDNAGLNTGMNSCVCELFRKELALPNLIMVGCMCHSLQLGIYHSVKEILLPRNIDFMCGKHTTSSHIDQRGNFVQPLV